MTNSSQVRTGQTPSSGAARFDQLIHPAHRLRICATLEPFDEYEFSALRDVVGVSDSVLSKQLSILMDAQYVTQRRATRDGRRRVWLALSPQGRTAFGGHVRALRDIVGQFETPMDGSIGSSGTPLSTQLPLASTLGNVDHHQAR